MLTEAKTESAEAAARRACPVGSHNDWDPLEEVLVGSARGANDPALDLSLRNFFQPSEEEAARARVGRVPERVVEEVEEDIEGFIAVLKRSGVVVRRPSEVDQTAEIASPLWRTTGMGALMPRDGFVVFGDLIVETPMLCRSRHFESWVFKDLFLEYFRGGARWIAAPAPRLLDGTFYKSAEHGWQITDDEPLFDAANLLRCGRDVFYNDSNTGNALGRLWLQRHLGHDYRVRSVSLCEDHLGTTLFVLRPGTVLVNPSRLTERDIPEPLRRWEVLWAPTPDEDSYALDYPRASSWVSMNVLSLDPRHVVVEERQHDLMRLLERHGFTPIPVRYRHGRTLGGGFHCITLDIRRRGPLVDYFAG